MDNGNKLGIGKRIYNLREAAGMSQQDIADALKIKRETISMWENGSRDLKTGYTVELAKLFSVSTDYLLGLTDDPAPKPSAVDDLGISPEAVSVLVQAKKKTHSSFCFSEIISAFLEACAYEGNMQAPDGKDTLLYYISILNHYKTLPRYAAMTAGDACIAVSCVNIMGEYGEMFKEIRKKGYPFELVSGTLYLSLLRSRAIDRFAEILDEITNISVKGDHDGDD